MEPRSVHVDQRFVLTRSPASSLQKLILVLLAGGTPTVVVVTQWGFIRQHPILSAVLLLVYMLLIFLLRLLKSAYLAAEEYVSSVLNQFVVGGIARGFSRYQSRYIAYLHDMNSDVDIKGLNIRGTHALGIEQVFVDLSLEPTTPQTAPSGISTAAQLETSPGQRRMIWDIIGDRQSRVLAILGGPGSGKTTLLKHVVMELPARRKSEVPAELRRRIPVLITLRQQADAIVSESTIGLADLIRNTLSGFPYAEPQGWFEHILKRGNCVVMFDGLDEVDSETGRASVVEWVERQIATYPANSYILTSRPYGYRDFPINSADIAAVVPFTEKQISEFIHGWYVATLVRDKGRDGLAVREEARSSANDLLERLQADTTLSELASNPLLLTMIAHVHVYGGALPGSRSELYREVCQVFLGRRTAAKRLPSEYKTDQKQSVLQQLALHMMRHRLRYIDHEQVIQFVAPILAPMKRTTNASEFVEIIRDECGLLLEYEPQQYCFAHLTFQEFLAATQIREANEVAILTESIDDEWWRETTLLFVAQADADGVVAACLKGSNPVPGRLELAANCADEARQLDSNLREELEHLLLPEQSVDDSDRRAVAAKVALSRTMQRSIRVGEDAWLGRAPISWTEFAFFRQYEVDAVGLPPNRPLKGPGEPIVGINSFEAQDFAAWARGFKQNLRLPRADEVAGESFAKILARAEYSVWAQTDDKIACIGRVCPIQDTSALLLSVLLRDLKAAAGAAGFDGATLDYSTNGFVRRISAKVGIRRPPQGGALLSYLRFDFRTTSDGVQWFGHSGAPNRLLRTEIRPLAAIFDPIQPIGNYVDVVDVVLSMKRLPSRLPSEMTPGAYLTNEVGTLAAMLQRVANSSDVVSALMGRSNNETSRTVRAALRNGLICLIAEISAFDQYASFAHDCRSLLIALTKIELRFEHALEPMEALYLVQDLSMRNSLEESVPHGIGTVKQRLGTLSSIRVPAEF